ncbi:MAG TPA: GldG family protein [Burkholderiales bacterium]|nr:GldG family protein [Burkholderiales bacterium]
MKTDRRLQLQLLVQNTLFAVLLVAAAFMVVYVLKDSKLQWDISQNKRSTLSQATQNVLRKMSGPITITAYATTQDPMLGDVRQMVHEFLAPYRLIKPDITLTFVDPREQPKQTAAANVRANGELVIEYGKRSEHLTTLDEQTMTNLLMRLARNQERLVMYVDGHGEPKLDGNANFDLGDFGRQLANKGFRVQALNLSIAPEVPDNVSVLVLTHPRVDLLKGEVDKLMRYVERGGSLLWMIDQEPLHGLQPLVELLKLQLTPGVVVDPAAAGLGVAPTIGLSASYGMHPVTEHFERYNTAFPFVRAVTPAPEHGPWEATILVEVAQQGWVETGDLQGELRFDKTRDVRGPVPVVIALHRSVKDKDQRVIVTGGSSFLSNAYVGLLSNVDLGTNLLNWLATDENLITIQPRPRVDTSLTVTRSGLTLFVVGFLLLLPLAFLFAGGMIWWKRRRA